MARHGSVAATDEGRDAATTQLREHYAAGRLSLDQFQDRLDEAYRAQTARELTTATDGLPRVRQPIARTPQSSHPGNNPSSAWPVRAAAARLARWVVLALGALTAGSVLILALLVTALLVHGGLLADVMAALLAILAAGVVGVAALAWLARRLWRRHAWTEAAPSAGPSWPSLAGRAARLLLSRGSRWARVAR